MTGSFTRRELLARMAVTAAATVAASAVSNSVRAADDGTSLPRLDAADPAASALGYVSDATQVDAAKFKTYRAGQCCATCTQIQGDDGAEWRPCVLFQNKLVNANGWCSAYVRQA